MNLEKLETSEIIHLYSATIKELKRRNIIRTNNVIGELGEYLAINMYNKTPGLPNPIACSDRYREYRCYQQKRR